MSTISSKTSEGKTPLLVAIVGPTAIGKSGLAVDMAHRFGSAVINADSRQFYREMRIGTARPSTEELRGVPHYFMGDRSIEAPLTAGAFEKEAMELLEELFREKPILFLVGGSGLFIDAVLEGLDDELPPPDPEIRGALEQTLEESGSSPLLEELKEKDPHHYDKVDRDNPRRLIRALEVIRSTGRPLSSFRGKKKKERPFNILKIGLWTEREKLNERISERLDRMLREGLLDEVKALLPYREHRPLRTVGYQELFPVLEGSKDLGTACREIEKNTRHYAKRQMTWFRKAAGIEWHHPDEREKILARIEEASGIKGRPGPAPSDTSR